MFGELQLLMWPSPSLGRYLASILEVDEDDQDLLVHFEGWNQRHDEWIDFGSDRLRPLAPTTAQQFSTAKWVSGTHQLHASINLF